MGFEPWTNPFENLQEGEYYLSRPSPTVNDADYWGPKVDPDGIERDKLVERTQAISCLTEELAFLRSLPPGRLLDIGCGPGFLLSELPAAWERHGVEPSPRAATEAAAWGQIVTGNWEQARYPDNHFDAVVLHHVIEHVERPEFLIREVRRILKEDGWLILGTPDFDSGCARRYGSRYRLLHDQTHISLFSDASMRRFLRDHGFTIVHARYPFFETPYFTPETVLRLFQTDGVSPAFYGNFMTFYARKMTESEAIRLRNVIGHGIISTICTEKNLGFGA